MVEGLWIAYRINLVHKLNPKLWTHRLNESQDGTVGQQGPCTTPEEFNSPFDIEEIYYPSLECDPSFKMGRVLTQVFPRPIHGGSGGGQGPDWSEGAERSGLDCD